MLIRNLLAGKSGSVVNCASHKTLVITAMDSLYTLRMSVGGAR